MATRIITIDKDFSNHWQIAKERGFWELRNFFKGLASGDTAYFRTSAPQSEFLGRARLMTDQLPRPAGAPHAWSSSDPRAGLYKWRIDLGDFVDIPRVRLPWRELAIATGGPIRPPDVALIPDDGVAWLEERLGLRASPTSTLPSPHTVDTHFLGEDAVEFGDSSREAYGLAALTDRQAVISALREHDDLGRESFLAKYGFGEALRYVLVHSGRTYDSKAIVGAALAYQPGISAPLPARKFSGGIVGAASKLHELGFTVLDIKPASRDARPVAEVLDGESPSPEVQEVVEAVEAAAGRRRGGQGYGLSADERRAVECRAVSMVKCYLESPDGGMWNVTDVGTTQSYDLDARRDEDEHLFVEVKGTTGGGDEILLTKNEVELHRSVHPHNMLAIVTEIALHRSTAPVTASGGVLRVIEPFELIEDSLTPIAYRYSV